MGPNGGGAEQFRIDSRFRSGASSTRGASHGRLHFWRRRSKSSGAIRIRQSDKGLWVQTLVSRARPIDGTDRETRGAMDKDVARYWAEVEAIGSVNLSDLEVP